LEISLKTIKIYKLCILTIALLIFFLLVSTANVTLAQRSANNFTLTAYAAFSGHFKYGEWLPIIVELENKGADFDAEIRVSVTSNASTTTYTTPISMPSISRKRVLTYVLPNNFTRQLEVKLVSNQQIIATQTVNLEPHPPIDYLVGIIASERGALNLLNSVELPGVERQKTILDLSLAEIPDKFEGLRSFDLLIINDIDTSKLDSNQQNTLETWVDQGGRLVIGGGANTKTTLQGLPELFNFFKPGDVTTLESLNAIEEFTGTSQTILVPGPFVVTTGLLSSGKTLVSQNGIPLVTEYMVGNGYINFISLDLAVSPFDAWSGTTSFWQRLITTGSIYDSWQPSDMSARQQIAGQMPYSLSNLPILDLPSAQSLAILLGIYILIVGPLNYFFLRWWKKMHWAWFTIPIITIIFSIGAFSLGYLLHGSDLFINKIAIIKLQPNGRAHVTSFLGLFSPSRQTYQVEISGGGLLSPLDPFINPWDTFSSSSSFGTTREKTIVQDNPSFIKGVSVDQWSMQSFMVEGNSIEFGIINTDLTVVENMLIGEIVNESSSIISDAILVLDKRIQYLSDINPGEIININIVIDDLSQPDPGPPLSYLLIENQLGIESRPGSSPEMEAKRNILEAIFSRGNTSLIGTNNVNQSHIPILIGWVDNAPPTVIIDGKSPSQQTTALLYFPVTYNFPESGLINLPVGLIPGHLIEASPFGNQCGEPGTTSIYLDHAEAIFEFIMPANLPMSDIEINNLKLFVWSDSGWNNSPEIEFYDWNSKDWRQIEISNQGINMISAAQKYVRSDGVVRLRLNAVDITPSCYFMGLGLEANH
jgi:hypothetical protein